MRINSHKKVSLKVDKNHMRREIIQKDLQEICNKVKTGSVSREGFLYFLLRAKRIQSRAQANSANWNSRDVDATVFLLPLKIGLVDFI